VSSLYRLAKDIDTVVKTNSHFSQCFKITVVVFLVQTSPVPSENLCKLNAFESSGLSTCKHAVKMMLFVHFHSKQNKMFISSFICVSEKQTVSSSLCLFR
jgi:hypothetical protein